MEETAEKIYGQFFSKINTCYTIGEESADSEESPD